MADLTSAFASDAWRALDGAPEALERLQITGAGSLPSAFAVSDLAAASVGVAALAVAALADAPSVRVDRRQASLWFQGSIRPIGWSPAPIWDAIAGDYRGADGWIRLHTNAAAHKAAAQSVLGPCEDKAAMAAAVARWRVGELEAAVAAAGGCAAEMRSLDAWAEHPQGASVAKEPLVHRVPGEESGRSWSPAPGRPLQGVRVLDITRILAGPVATRFLAGYGAEVLRLDPPDWDEPTVAPEVTLGKRCARLDLKATAGRERFEALLSEADVFVHGLRPEALAQLGYGPDERRALAPGLVDVSLCAYGWSGPWANRRGFDSLVQMSAGIAEAGMGWRGAEVPTPLPVQALDFATGYLMAAAAVRGLQIRRETGQGSRTRLSLARTAKFLADADAGDAAPMEPAGPADFMAATEETGWGPAHRLGPPEDIAGAPAHWALPARPLGWAEPYWD